MFLLVFAVSGVLAVTADFDFILAMPLAAVAYLGLCRLFPYKACKGSNCKGGHVHAAGGNSFRLCRRCDGTGRRVRFGRRLTSGAPPD